MIRNGDAWVRHGTFVKPVSNDPGACLHNPTGPSGAHKKAYEQMSNQARTPSDPQPT
jgi:hypothetical protein